MGMLGNAMDLGAAVSGGNVGQPAAGHSPTQTGPAPRPGAPGGPGGGPPTPGPASTPGGVPVTPTPPLNSLYAHNPGATTFDPSNRGAATTTGAAPTANASNVRPLAAITNGQINPNDSTNAASQLDAITNANSPYIQQATHQGLLTAASRGLENSSIGAGAAEAAAVAAAAPFAQQNAGAATGGEMQNSQLNTQAAEFNASQANANQQLNAQMQTQQTQFNASQEQAAKATNAAAQNAMTQQTQQLNEQINQQFLAGSQSQTLASIQGQYNELIQGNASASGMYTSMLNNIGAVMANKDIAPERVGDTILAMKSLLAGGLGVIDAIQGGGAAPTPGFPTAGTPATPGVTPSVPGVGPGGVPTPVPGAPTNRNTQPVPGWGAPGGPGEPLNWLGLPTKK